MNGAHKTREPKFQPYCYSTNNATTTIVAILPPSLLCTHTHTMYTYTRNQNLFVHICACIQNKQHLWRMLNAHILHWRPNQRHNLLLVYFQNFQQPLAPLFFFLFCVSWFYFRWYIRSAFVHLHKERRLVHFSTKSETEINPYFIATLSMCSVCSVHYIETWRLSLS